MMERIKAALKDCGITLWRINERVDETAELFFVKKQLDTRRSKDTRKYTVTVFRDVDGKRGSTDVKLIASMDDAQLNEALKGAYYAAQFAANPMFELPDPVHASIVEQTGELAEAPLARSAGKMAKALFAPDIHEDAFVNSAEVFVGRRTDHIISSNGTDVSFTAGWVNGEFVVQCRGPEDVEMFHEFEYDELDEQALRAKVAEALAFVRDRARAQKVLKSGKYDVVFSGDAVPEVLDFYVRRSSAPMVYAKYSTWQRGEDVQGDAAGERLNLTLRAFHPYSQEGIPTMDGLPLMEDGRLLAWHGPNRFCRYLGIKPTGDYTRVSCANGTMPFEELKKGPCLWTVSFSDFQMDAMSGHFGGEIRLAYLIEEGKVTPVTGGSVNGSILEAQKELVFSQERYQTAFFDGPYAVRVKGVSVAGI